MSQRKTPAPSPSAEGPQGPRSLDLDPDRALFSGKVQGLAVTIYGSERPLGGLVGLLDWRFHGAITEYLRAGVITGAQGESAYVPISRNGRTHHIILLGAGTAPSPGGRLRPSREELAVLAENLRKLRLPDIGLSKKDFGGLTDETLREHMEGIPLWILQ